MKDWMIGLAVAAAVPFAWKWAKSNIPKMIVAWTVKEVGKALSGQGVNDVDLAALLKEVTLALVRFAEKKLPAGGVGPERMALIKKVAFGLPLVGAFLAANEKDFTELVETCVAEEDSALQKIITQAAPEAPPASPS